MTRYCSVVLMWLHACMQAGHAGVAGEICAAEQLDHGVLTFLYMVSSVSVNRSLLLSRQ